MVALGVVGWNWEDDSSVVGPRGLGERRGKGPWVIDLETPIKAVAWVSAWLWI